MRDFLWLVRDGDDLFSSCRCELGIAGTLPQADCPWCGCGWVFACVNCGQCFAFARVRRLAGAIEDVAQKELLRRGRQNPTRSDLKERVEMLIWMVEGLEEDQRVVVLDGTIIPVEQDGPIEFEGWHSRHILPWVPQVRALTHPEVTEDILGSSEYWLSRRIDQH